MANEIDNFEKALKGKIPQTAILVSEVGVLAATAIINQEKVELNRNKKQVDDFQKDVNKKVVKVQLEQDNIGAPTDVAIVKLVPVSDLLNTPSLCTIGAQVVTETQVETLENGETISYPVQRIVGGVTLPADVNIEPEFEKYIIVDSILNGSPVTEYVGRKATRFTINATFRAAYTNGQINANDLSNNIFPQSLLEDFFQQVFQPNGSISIQNSILNGLGITNIIVTKMKPKFTNGSYNIGLTLDCYEDVAGSSLLLS